MQLFLTWSVFLTSLFVFVVSIWWWLDTQADMIITNRTKGSRVSVRLAARGELRLAWFRLIDGAMWLSLGALVLFYGRGPTNTTYAGRLILLALMVTEVAKLLSDRWARFRVDRAVAEELDEVELKKAAELAAVAKLVEAKHVEVMDAIAANTKETEGASAAAHEAYTEANHVNKKIEDLNNRLLEQEREVAARVKTETKVSEETNEAIQGIEKHTADSAASLKAIEKKKGT